MKSCIICGWFDEEDCVCTNPDSDYCGFIDDVDEVDCNNWEQ